MQRIFHSAGISACEKDEKWQRALALLRERREAKLEPGVISYNAGISACEKDAKRHQVLTLLRETREARLEPDVISYTAEISACERGEHWQRALAPPCDLLRPPSTGWPAISCDILLSPAISCDLL